MLVIPHEVDRVRVTDGRNTRDHRGPCATLDSPCAYRWGICGPIDRVGMATCEPCVYITACSIHRVISGVGTIHEAITEVRGSIGTITDHVACGDVHDGPRPQYNDSLGYRGIQLSRGSRDWAIKVGKGVSQCYLDETEMIVTLDSRNPWTEG